MRDLNDYINGKVAALGGELNSMKDFWIEEHLLDAFALEEGLSDERKREIEDLYSDVMSDAVMKILEHYRKMLETDYREKGV